MTIIDNVCEGPPPPIVIRLAYCTGCGKSEKVNLDPLKYQQMKVLSHCQCGLIHFEASF